MDKIDDRTLEQRYEEFRDLGYDHIESRELALKADEIRRRIKG